jgi:hypothetical protein
MMMPGTKMPGMMTPGGQTTLGTQEATTPLKRMNGSNLLGTQDQ